jgi:hypothetical protein
MIAFALFSAAICCATGFFFAKLYQWRQDVLYGPYIINDDRRGRRKRPSYPRW